MEISIVKVVKGEKRMNDYNAYLIWKHKNFKPIEVVIDDFIKTQIELCLLDMRKGRKETDEPNN